MAAARFADAIVETLKAVGGKTDVNLHLSSGQKVGGYAHRYGAAVRVFGTPKTLKEAELDEPDWIVSLDEIIAVERKS